ncbi:MAG: DEAD/DEAH box helicase [Deltaproteobacteria bacterium]|nr:DEAD/DEAH box helicase [Deltaproteobacteria bacterium]
MACSFPSLAELKEEYFRTDYIEKRGRHFLQNDLCNETTVQKDIFRFVVEDRFDDFTVEIDISGERLKSSCNCHFINPCCSHIAAALLKLHEKIMDGGLEEDLDSNIYTRQEMIERVLQERKERAEKDFFKLEIGDTVYGTHQVTTAAGQTYQITVRDFDKSQGYCSCPDFQINKLGTCKHLLYAVNKLKKDLPYRKLLDEQSYPFIDIYCDPLNEYHITSFWRGAIASEIEGLLADHFSDGGYVMPPQYAEFLDFLDRAENHKKIFVRPEVREKIERHFEAQQSQRLAADLKVDYSVVKAKLFPYQKEGVEFSICKRGVIIADEMGLGKTLQAITVAILKKELFNFRKTLVICPVSLKYQWKQEIEKFSSEKAMVVEGSKKERYALYKSSDAFFLITNYEAVLRDVTTIKNYPPDLVILDEAQRIKNYETKTSAAVKAIPRKHSLVITGTPIENRLIDLYSVMNFVDPELLAPLWEFSMQHCYFDKSKKNRITGYFNLQSLKEKLDNVVIRRLKKDVMAQLPELSEITVPIELSHEQSEMHSGFAQALSIYINKKHKTFYDMQRIFQILTSMRMVCDSTYLIDKETNISPKLKELEEILLEKLDIVGQKRKIIIFSEWKTMLHLIENFLKSKNIGYVRLSGEVAVKNRGKLIDEFAGNADCLVFLSTEAGGAGLNLQMADTVINFELPWNPAKKNQRIGRIHRIGQKNQKLTVINLVSTNSIEERIASGIVVKEALFDAVLNEADLTDEVDFSAKGRSTMIEQIEKMVTPFVVDEAEKAEIEELSRGEAAVESDLGEMVDDEEESDEGGKLRLLEGVKESKESKESDPENNLQSLAEVKRDSKTAVESASSEPFADLPSAEAMENTLNQGIGFLSGLMEMATGKKLLADGQSVTVDKETGEVTMKFKLPGF